MTRPRTGLAYLDAGLDRPGTVLAFAHRGGAFHPEIEGLENTLAAFRHAVDLGYGYLETDVHATADGVLLAFHDAVLDRVTDGTGAVAEMTHAAIRAARVGGREEIPTLVMLLEEFPRARFNIDVKSDAAVAPLADLVDRARLHDRLCVGSFSARRMRAFRRRVDRPMATACGAREVLALRFVPGSPLARVLARGPGAALQVPHRLRGLQVVTGELVDRAHAAGRPVHVWTVDDPDEMHALLDLGIDGLMTDRTDVLREVLLARGQWMGEL